MTATSAAITVHPLVLLEIADHVTRVRLQHSGTASPTTTAAATFLPTVGLLMGTSATAGPSEGGDHAVHAIDGTATTISASFELPLRLRSDNGMPVAVDASGDAAFLCQLLTRDVDWQAALQHREQLSAVFPEAEVVGCYVVCTTGRDHSVRHGGSHAGCTTTPAAAPSQVGDPSSSSSPSMEGSGAVKKAKGEAVVGGTSSGVAAVAQSLQLLLRKNPLLPPTTPSFVLVTVYDDEVTRANGRTALSPATARLPFTCLSCPVRGDDGAAALQEERAAVGPADMEWIALATEASLLPATGPATDATTAADTAATSNSSGGGLFRHLRRAASLSSPVASTSPAPLSAAGAAAAQPLSQNGCAAQELLGSLRAATRFLDSVAPAAAPSQRRQPDDVELLRSVATCVRNVPDGSAEPSQAASIAGANSMVPSEAVLGAVLAVEAQMAVQLRALQQDQHGLISTRRSAMATARSQGYRAGASGASMSAARASSLSGGHSRRHQGRSGGGGDTREREVTKILLGHVNIR